MKKLIIALFCLGLVACSSKQIEAENVESKHKIGEIIEFGQYEQDGNVENGKENIEWIVINDEDGKLTLFSKNVLELQTILPMNNDSSFFDNTWKNGSERYWLNNDFLDSSFSEKEKKKMEKRDLDNQEYSFKKKNGTLVQIPEDASTSDYVYTLSVKEFEEFVGKNDFRSIVLTDSVRSQLSYINNPVLVYSLRSRNSETNYPIIVTEDGSLNTCVPGTPGLVIGIRPVITIKSN
ncbi:MAG: DUF6273 domain-containing protein [Bacillota bacterium]|nr:DUF6273 domain-containing protein [Bacillota bacterium]